MHYDPYESAESKKRRLMSNIGIIVILAAMVAGIVFLLLPNGMQTRYDFDSLKTRELTADSFADGKSEFKALIDTISASEHIIVGESFKEKFPISYSLLSLDSSVYSESDAVYSEDAENLNDLPFVKLGGGYITVAQAVVSTEKDCRDLLIISYKADAKQSDGSVKISLGEYECYTVRYNTRNPQIPLKLLVGEQSALLDMYKIKLSAIGENPISAGYSLTLNHAFEAKRAREDLYHHIVFDPINESYGSAEIITKEASTEISMKQEKAALIKNENELAYEIKSGDKRFNLLDKVDFEFNFESDSNKIIITFN